MYRQMLAPALAAALAALAAPASAADRSAASTEAFTVTVPVADLDLSTQAGRASLRKRIRAAAVRTCAPDPDPASPERSAFEACRQAFARAAAAR